MTAVTSEGAPGTRHQLRQRLRSTVLGPRGGGTTRRRASDAFRLALAVVVVLVSIVLLVIVGLLVPRLTVVRWTAVAGVLTWGVCALLGVILGSAAGRPPAELIQRFSPPTCPRCGAGRR